MNDAAASRLITSRDNPRIKQLRQLVDSAQARRRAGLALLDGVHVAQAWLQHRGAAQLCVVDQDVERHPEVAPILARCEALGTPCLIVASAVYRPLRQVDNGIGVLLVVPTPVLTTPSVLQGAAVLLDGVQDPGNVGSVLRSAAAAGITQIFCAPGTTAAWSPKVLRAGMGAHFVLDIHEHVDLAALCADSRVPVLATSSHAAQTIYEYDLSQPVAWLFGHEGQGVSPALAALASQELVIPHLGQIESLNIAAAAAVCFFEQVRQRGIGAA